VRLTSWSRVTWNILVPNISTKFIHQYLLATERGS
jgi:hypothetical protein